jgi:hypothetical protein
MSTITNAIKHFFTRALPLSELEIAIFAAVRNKLPANDAQLWDKQLAAVNKVHRSPDGKEVNLYVMRNGKSAFPSELCFARKDEFKIAVVDLATNTGATTLRGRVWCVNGHVFSIEYKSSHKEFERNGKGEWQISAHIENYPN